MSGLPIFPDFRVVSAPTSEPVTLDEAKAQIRVTHNLQDQHIYSLIVAAREHIETLCNTALITQTLEIFLPSFPAGEFISLPRWPLTAITVFEWTDMSGIASQWTPTGSDLLDGTVVKAHVETARRPGGIRLAASQQWPSGEMKSSQPVRIRFTAGFGTAAAVPVAIKAAMKILIGQWYRNTEASSSEKHYEIPMGVDSLLRNYQTSYA
jgi:uncharacterized phiE125 gp8 family phage protein